jgi:hypothetical protein
MLEFNIDNELIAEFKKAMPQKQETKIDISENWPTMPISRRVELMAAAMPYGDKSLLDGTTRGEQLYAASLADAQENFLASIAELSVENQDVSLVELACIGLDDLSVIRQNDITTVQFLGGVTDTEAINMPKDFVSFGTL